MARTGSHPLRLATWHGAAPVWEAAGAGAAPEPFPALAEAQPTQVQTNLVFNGGFASPVRSTTKTSDNNITGWNGTAIGQNRFGIAKNKVAPKFYVNLPGGDQYAYVNSDSIFQDVGQVLTKGHIYTLNVYLGVPDGYTGMGVVDLETETGTILVRIPSMALTSTPGAWTKYIMPFTETGADVGHDLIVRLGKAPGPPGSRSEVDFAQVTLTEASPAPGSP
jgi:hypothetical protein